MNGWFPIRQKGGRGSKDASIHLNMEVFLSTKQRDGSTISIHEDARRKHMVSFGKPGVGKTTLMRNIVAADLRAGNGLTVIDPQGSLIEDILDAIPVSVKFGFADPLRALGSLPVRK